MTLRERRLAGAVGLLALGLFGYFLVVEPVLAWHEEYRMRSEELEQKIAAANGLIGNATKIEREWRAYQASGLLKSEDAAQYQIQQLIAEAAEKSGLSVDSSVGGQRVAGGRTDSTHYDQLRLSVLAHGTLAQSLDFTARLASSALPIRIDRSEWSTRDGRRDEVDLSLTLSMPLRSLKAAVKVPAHTPGWTPKPFDPASAKAITQARPFLSDRHAPKVVVAPPPREKPVVGPVVPVAPPPPGTGWVLVGITDRSGIPAAFFRDTAGKVELQLAVGGTVAGGKIMAIDSSGIRISFGEVENAVAVGCELTGKPYAFGKTSARAVATSVAKPAPSAAAPATPANATEAGASSATVSTTPATPETPPATPAAAPSEADREAILQRLREQRNRSQ